MSHSICYLANNGLCAVVLLNEHILLETVVVRGIRAGFLAVTDAWVLEKP